jgi:phospholipid/cholesterol/gamma-HCH transport system permease protein
MQLRRSIERLGGMALDGVEAGVELWRVAIATFHGAASSYWRGARPRGEILKQMYAIGNRSLLFVAVTLGFIGMVMVYQTCLLTTQVIDGRNQVGPQFARLLILDFAPTLTGMMLATRVGAGIAAEIGSMKVTEQVDALRMSGVAPVDYLIVPRFLACVVMTLVLTIFAVVVAWATGGLTGHYSFQINPRAFFSLDMVRPAHAVLGLTKALAYGMAIPIVSGFCGLRAKGSSEGVGWATTAAVIGSSFAVIVLDFLISTIGILALGAAL